MRIFLQSNMAMVERGARRSGSKTADSCGGCIGNRCDGLDCRVYKVVTKAKMPRQRVDGFEKGKKEKRKYTERSEVAMLM
jgi:hypothetical protein